MTTAFFDEPARRTPITHETEVLVVGGGSAGVCAAVAAARGGADVLLVEAGGSLGGLATGGLIILLLTLDDGIGRQAVAGLCQEISERLVKRGAAWHPAPEEWGSDAAALVERDRRRGLVWGRSPHRVRYSVAYDPEEMKFALQELASEAGVRLLLHSLACDPILAEGRIAGVAFQGKSGRFAVRARTVVDATGDGDVFAGAGCAHEKEDVLPWLWFVAGGVADAGEAAAAGFGFETPGAGRVLLPWGATEKVEPAHRRDLSRGPDCRAGGVPPPRDGGVRPAAPRSARLRRRAPLSGGRAARHHGEPPPRRPPRPLARRHGHRVRRRRSPSPATGRSTARGTRSRTAASCPPSSPNLLVAGRCISVDHRTHHATKEIPACMATGEAAGTAAALALRASVDAAELDVAALRARLRAQGAILELPPS